MNIDLDILKQIISDKVDGLKRKDLDTYNWKEKLQNNENDLMDIEGEEKDEEKEMMLKAIMAFMEQTSNK